jgi:flagellar hook-basal body complex protein FliE
MTGPVSLSGVLALRAEILERSRTLGAAHAAGAPAGQPEGAAPAKPADFTRTIADALNAVHALQGESGAQAAAWERGETQDLAAVMLARQKASIAFEATVQTRNRLLSAYRDIMNMPV